MVAEVLEGGEEEIATVENVKHVRSVQGAYDWTLSYDLTYVLMDVGGVKYELRFEDNQYD